MSNVVGKAVIEISADPRKLTAGVDEAKRSIKSLSIAAGESIGAGMRTSLIAMTAAASAAAVGLGALIANSINAADNLNDLSKKTGVSVEDLSGLALAAKQSGTDLEGLAGSINKLSQNIGKDPEKFRKLGISAKDPIEAFKQLADIFAAVDDPQTRAALGAEALGKSWQSAAPVLSEGSKAIGEMVEKGKKLSGVTQQLASDADAFNDQLEEMKATAAGLGTKLAGEMLPAFTDITKTIKIAYEESGKLSALWAALGSIGAFLYTNELDSTATKIRDLQFELKVLEDRKGNTSVIDAILFGSKNDIIGQIEEVKRKLLELQKTAKPKPPEVKKPEADPKVTKRVQGFIAGDAKVGKSAAQKAAEEQKKLIQAGAELAASLIAQDAGLSADFAKKWESLGTAYRGGAISLKQLTDAQAQLLEQQPAMKNAADAQEKEADRILKTALAYQDASIAAQAYIDTIKNQNARDIAGIGRGEEFRANSAAKSGIEDKQTTQRQGLEGDLRRGQITQEQFDVYLGIVNDTYAKEVEAYDARTAAIKEKQADWLNGASEAFANYQTSAKNVAGNSAAMFSNAFDGLTDGVASSISAAILQGKSLEDSLKSVAMNVADAFITSFIKIQIQQLLIDKTAAAGYAATIAAQSQAMVAMAGLNAFASTAAIPIVGPALAPGAGAAAVALAEGFAGAAIAAASASIASARGGFDIPAGVNPITQLHEKEMVLPAPQANVIRDLARGDGPKGGSGAITIVNNTSARIGKVTEQRLSNGERALIIEEAAAATAAQLSDPNSRTSRAMARNFNTQRSR